MKKWPFVLQAILLAILGVIFLRYPLETLINFMFILGIFVVVAGIMSIVKAFKSDTKGFFIFNGVIDVLFGLTLCFSPLYSSEFFVIFFGVWEIIKGISLLCEKFQLKTAGFNFKTIYTIILIILGVLVIIYPIIALAVAPIVIGIDLLLFAVYEIILCFEI